MWLDYFKPELTYHQEETTTIDLGFMHRFLRNNRFKVGQSIDVSKLIAFLCNSSATEQRPSFMLPFDNERQVQEMNVTGIDASVRYSEFLRISNSSVIQGAKSMLVVIG